MPNNLSGSERMAWLTKKSTKFTRDANLNRLLRIATSLAKKYLSLSPRVPYLLFLGSFQLFREMRSVIFCIKYGKKTVSTKYRAFYF